MTQPQLGFRAGDKIPFCYGMAADQRYYSFEDQAGRPAALILAGAHPQAEVAGLIGAFAARVSDFEALGVDICVLAMVAAPGWPGAVVPDGVKLIHCMDAGLFNAAGGEPCVLLADRAVRLADAFAADPAKAVAGALAAAAALPREMAAEASCPAPVLIRPGLFDPDLRRRLIAHFEAGAHEAGAVAGIDGDGQQINRIDAAKKHRRDLVIEPSEPIHGEVVQAIGTRLVPEIRKAFQAEVAHLDRMLIVRYDDDGGYFLRHRDNSSAHLAWREFALSVNLNTGDYEGGRLRFPEYNDHFYNPPAGAGCVFSASLLHEAMPVTRGSRYVLLTFLHSAKAEAKRLESLAA
jgi:predicted 2-oxoglutarate/Fe(II)-dependent dioxygenase YbiX